MLVNALLISSTSYAQESSKRNLKPLSELEAEYKNHPNHKCGGGLFLQISWSANENFHTMDTCNFKQPSNITESEESMANCFVVNAKKQLMSEFGDILSEDEIQEKVIYLMRLSNFASKKRQTFIGNRIITYRNIDMVEDYRDKPDVQVSQMANDVFTGCMKAGYMDIHSDLLNLTIARLDEYEEKLNSIELEYYKNKARRAEQQWPSGQQKVQQQYQQQMNKCNSFSARATQGTRGTGSCKKICINGQWAEVC